MARNQEMRKKRDQQIIDQYNMWSEKGYRHDFIVKVKMSDCLLMPRTIEAIIRGEYDKKSDQKENDSQLDLFANQREA